MKKLALYTLLCAAVLASCRKDDTTSLPVEKSYADPKQQLDSFKTVLGSAPNGWVGTLTPRDGSELFSVYFQLDNGKSEVTLYTDLDAGAAATPSKSGFTVGITQTVNPTLSFHEGSQLAGIKLVAKRGVDTAYALRYTNGDTLVLTGNKYSDELKLVKAGAQVKTDYTAGRLETAMAAAADFFNQPGFLALKPGGTQAFVFFNTDNKTSGFAFVNNNSRVSAGTGYAYTLTGIALHHPVLVGNQAVSALTWDATANNFYAMTGNNKVYLERTNVPVIPVHYMLGGEIPGQLTLLPPSVYPLPGWTADFKTIWDDAANRFGSVGYPISKVVMDFQTGSSILNMNIYVAGTYCKYTFKYTKTAGGVYTFVMQPFANDTPGANGNALKSLAVPLTSMLSANRFSLDYLDAPDGVFVSFKSADKPSIGFTGYW
ncbi:DUF4302 domain-containing protein [Chitinophaga oryzae]|uniref:DUF4302 domain-containing protein n=1 Tax=Chitinophaga oryzae TaxID=2725414 RepID=A0AAE7D8E3_9BACT|nr:DUF4302 domain-containing protein [Chitinophaga oryzae]QJB33736.1 DUF4302 domain-containing protein [Chitinophaga oryzae]QJB40260.1 DUF4302 domain-containing protein [Chitinophaga oryzae]